MRVEGGGLRVYSVEHKVSDVTFRVQGLGSRVQGLGFGISVWSSGYMGLGVRVYLECKVHPLGKFLFTAAVQGAEFRIKDSGFKT